MSSKQIVNCPSCFKSYKKTACYEKHILYCDRELKSTNIPSNTQLLEMITNLTEKYNGVQQELQNIKGQIYTKNRKIDVLKWLNQSQNKDEDEDEDTENQLSFIEILQNIDISMDDLNLLFENNFVTGVFEIINRHLNSHYKIDKLIKCFNQKKNVLYICVSNNWAPLENNDFINIMKIINVKIFDRFKQYRDMNSDKIGSDSFQIQYNANLKKILCVNIPFDTKCTRIQNKIYTEYKECIKSITEIELI
jgi:hypothetical protein